MKLKTFTRIALVIAALALCVLAEVKYQADQPTYETQVIASGVIESKFESDYACGSKNRYTCYARYLEVDGERHLVQDNVFTSNAVGDRVTLAQEVNTNHSDRSSLLSFLAFALHWIMIVVPIATIAFVVVNVVIWAAMKSDKQTLKEYFSEFFTGY